MPVYEYKCHSCQTKFELRRSFSQADADTSCPHCQGQDVQRMLSTFACFSKDAGGASSAVGGSSCSGCASGSCASCGH